MALLLIAALIAAGVFYLLNMPTSESQLQTRSTHTPSTHSAPIPRSAAPTGLVVESSRAATAVHVLVRDLEQAPLQGIAVDLWHPILKLRISGFTDAKGAVRLRPGFPMHEADVRANVSPSQPALGSLTTSIHDLPRDASGQLLVQLPRRSSYVEFWVTDEDHRPFAGASLRVRPSDPEVITDERGYAWLGPVLEGLNSVNIELADDADTDLDLPTANWFRFDPARHDSVSRADLVVYRKRDLVLQTQLRPSGPAKVRLILRRLRGPYANSDFSELDLELDVRDLPKTITVGSGEWKIEALPDPESSFLSTGTQVFEVRRSEGNAVEVPVAESHHYVAGQVLDADGAPLPKAVITATTLKPSTLKEAFTDGEGRFVIFGLPKGDVVLWCRPYLLQSLPGRPICSARRTDAVTDSEVVIHLSLGLIVELHVSDTRKEGRELRLDIRDADVTGLSYFDPDGAAPFRIHGLGRAQYRIRHDGDPTEGIEISPNTLDLTEQQPGTTMRVDVTIR
ncbi:MAG: carboxypeptidase-like regulatory domain-containing protein [Planctomycetota bacterium]